jgi:hypothetical protein
MAVEVAENNILHILAVPVALVVVEPVAPEDVPPATKTRTAAEEGAVPAEHHHYYSIENHHLQRYYPS